MQSATWLRIAAGLAAFQTVGHTIGAVLAGPSSPEEAALRETMGAFRVSLMGMERTYWDFYLGSGWAITALAAPIVLAALITICLIIASIPSRSIGAAAVLLCVAALSPAAARAQSPAPPPPPSIDLTELRAYVTRFTGANPSDCGQQVKDLERSLRCAYDAAKARKSFWTFKHAYGIDSQVFEGLLGTPEGTIHQFWYSSTPCGGPECSGRFSVSRCGIPTVLKSRSFGCDDANPRRFAKPEPTPPIPSPESLRQ
jgi:hypothetical protein